MTITPRLGAMVALGAIIYTLDARGRRPRFYIDALWGFQLKELPEGRTRLVVSGYASARPRLLQAIADLFFWEPAHWIMQTRQFSNLKRRAEGRPHFARPW